MEKTLLSSTVIIAVIFASAADAIWNDRMLLKEWKSRMKKGVIFGVFFSLIPCFIVHAANTGKSLEDGSTYSTIQYNAALIISSITFTLGFTLLNIASPSPANNSFRFLQGFTLLFWAGALAFLFYSSVFLVNKLVLLVF